MKQTIRQDYTGAGIGHWLRGGGGHSKAETATAAATPQNPVCRHLDSQINRASTPSPVELTSNWVPSLCGVEANSA